MSAVPARVDKLEKVVTLTPKSNSLGRLLQPFAANSSTKVEYSPLKQPFSTPKRVVSFR
jgi:hypothetical protein